MEKIIIEDGVEFHVDDGLLVWMGNVSGDEAKKVTIPHILKSGDVINELDTRFCEWEKFSEITISDEITKVKKGAFRGSRCPKVNWSAGCTKVPSKCFVDSSALEVTNLENVTKIGNAAFSECQLTTIKWPSKCETIPKECFCRARLASISNLDNVKEVKDFAFMYASDPQLGQKLANVERIGYGVFDSYRGSEFVWMPKCKTIPDNSFGNSEIETISNIENVEIIENDAFWACERLTHFNWPLKCKIIPAGCFSISGLESISGIESVEEIEEHAFCGTKLTTFTWPRKCKVIPATCFARTPLKSINGIDDVEIIEATAFEDSELDETELMSKGRTNKLSCKIESFQCDSIYVNDPAIFPEGRYHFTDIGEIVVHNASMNEVNNIGDFMRTHNIGSNDRKQLVLLYSTDESGQLYASLAWRNGESIYVSNDNLKDYIVIDTAPHKAKIARALKNGKMKISVEHHERREQPGKDSKHIDHFDITLETDPFKKFIGYVWNVNFNYKWLPGSEIVKRGGGKS